MLEEGWVRFGTYNGLAAQHRLNLLKDVLRDELEATHGGHDASSEEEAARRRASGTHGDRATTKGDR